jgi:hypothetical protein
VEYESDRLLVTVGQPGAGIMEEYSLSVTCLSELMSVVNFAATSRAHLVVSEPDWDRVRGYVNALVANCPKVAAREAHELFLRYFEPAGDCGWEGAARTHGKVRVRGFDPPWFQSDDRNDLHLSFGVAEGTSLVDTELTVAVVTPAGLQQRAQGERFVLSHRATIIVPEIDLSWVHEHIVRLVEDACAAPDIASAIPLLQRYFRTPWEDSMSRNLDILWRA